MTEEEQKKRVEVTDYGSHVAINFPNGSWLEYEFKNGDMMGWDSRKKENFSSLLKEFKEAPKEAPKKVNVTIKEAPRNDSE